MQTVLVGIAAGFAAALMFVAPIGGTVLAFPLFLLTGLPIGLAGLGWGVAASGVAVFAGTIVILAALSVIGAASFLLLFAGPVFWITRLALMSRPVDSDKPDGDREWYPLGRMLLHLAGAVAIGVVLVGVLIGFDPQSLTGEVAAALAKWFASAETGAAPPTAADLEPFVRFNIAVMPFTVAAVLVFVQVFDLWLATMVARASGRLTRPRDRLWSVALPNQALAALGAAVVLAFLPGATGEIARVAAGALAGAAALTGLAVLHAVTFGMNGRAALLVVVYALLVLSGLPLLLFVILAIAEAFLSLRARRFGGAPPT